MRHIITGGAGFTGQCLARLLGQRDEEVILFDLEQARPAGHAACVIGDVTRAADLDRIGLQPDDVVYHLAARQFSTQVPRSGRSEWFDEVNVAGTREVVAAMRRSGAKQFVFFSTDMTYGIPEQTPVPPDHPQRPLGPYGTSKLQAEQIIRRAQADLAHDGGFAATIFRPRLITGPGRLGILAKLFRLIRAGLPVPMIGSGRNRYQMISVEDCSRAAMRAVELGCPTGPFNLGSATPPTTRELLEAVIKHAGSRSFVLPLPAAPLKTTLAVLDRLGATLLYPEQFLIADQDILLDTADTKAVLGWQPATDDIVAMIAAYDAFVNATYAKGSTP